MKIYQVGGAVRDRLLDLSLKDRDWVVVGATEEEMLAQGFKRADAEFPVFLHPETGEEYALARRETKTGPGYKGFETYAGPDVTLEEDLKRRDLTINAIAEDESGHIVDPLDGQEDLHEGLLRHITPAFEEDPVRLLRVARFAARLGRWGFRLAHDTHALMKKMAASDDLTALKPERVWQEMRLALATEQPWRFFEVLHRCHALGVLMPSVAASMGEPGGHKQGGESEAVAALKRAARISDDLSVRFAAMVFYAVKNDPKALQHLPVERHYQELLDLALAVADDFQAPLNGDVSAVMAVLDRTRALQQLDRFKRLLALLSALQPEGAEQASVLYLKALQAAEQVTAQTLKARGLSGAQLGEALKLERVRAIALVITP